MHKQISDWWRGRFFRHIHGNNLVYNTCWEDPALDRIALELAPGDKIMMITSAGCNALDYALLSPARICAVDMNPRQNALLELKIAGIRSLEFETFFELFGRGRLDDFENVYRGQLRPLLTARSREIWDKNTDYFQPGDSGRGFYFRGTSGLVARVINHYIDLGQMRSSFDALLRSQTLEEQKAIYHHSLKGLLFNKLVRWAISRDTSLSFIGVPRPQRLQVENGYLGGIAKFIEDCVEYVFTQLPLRDNYFWSLYLQGQYTTERCPEYLKRENFRLLKDGLVDSISTHTSTIADFLQQSGERFSKFVLLDHMDWLSANGQPILAAEWQNIFDSATAGARAIWRSGGMRTDFVDEVPVTVAGKRQKVGDRVRYHRELANELHALDRVHTYGSFYIADLMAT